MSSPVGQLASTNPISPPVGRLILVARRESALRSRTRVLAHSSLCSACRARSTPTFRAFSTSAIGGRRSAVGDLNPRSHGRLLTCLPDINIGACESVGDLPSWQIILPTRHMALALKMCARRAISATPAICCVVRLQTGNHSLWPNTLCVRPATATSALLLPRQPEPALC
jgi:hypothetical protein